MRSHVLSAPLFSQIGLRSFISVYVSSLNRLGCLILANVFGTICILLPKTPKPPKTPAANPGSRDLPCMTTGETQVPE